MLLFSNERGALLFAVVVLLAALAVVMAAVGSRTTHSQLRISADEGRLKAFYAAEAGEQMMVAYILEDGINRFKDAIKQWTKSGSVLPSAPNFFEPELVLSGASLGNGSSFADVSATISHAGQQIEHTSQSFLYDYEITSMGVDSQRPSEMTVIRSTGRLVLSVQMLSFASFALFTNAHTLPGGNKVWFTNTTRFTGRVHTNDRLAFAFNPGASFENGPVSSVDRDAWFHNCGSPVLLDADRNGDWDVPTFADGFTRGIDTLALPPNAYEQKQFALGTLLSDPESNAEIRIALGLPESTDPPPNGIYVPNDGSFVTAGIYIQGEVSNMLLQTDGMGNQIYDIQLSSGASSTISVNQYLNQTTVDGQAYDGVPQGLVYTAGGIRSLGGPGRVEGVPPPAIHADTKLTIVAEGDIVVTSDITYTHNPLEIAGATNVLGLFTPGGDIRIGALAPDDIVIHSSLMTSSDTGVVTVDNYSGGAYRGVATVVGGLVSHYFGAFGTLDTASGQRTGYSRNFIHDNRLGSGFVPPLFPNTTVLWSPIASVTRVSWSKTIERT